MLRKRQQWSFKMSDLSTFAITKRWPATRADIIQLYSFPTPNGVKASIMLEETGLEYEAHRVTLSDADVKSPEFLSLNPNNKIPAIIDPNGPDGAPIGLFESGAILLYLASKTGKFAGSNATEQAKVTQWLMFQMGGLGPMFGQIGFAEGRRILGVLNGELANKDWIAGSYSIADMAIAPWLRALDFYGAKEILGWDGFTNVTAYLDRFLERDAVQRALNVPPREG